MYFKAWFKNIRNLFSTIYKIVNRSSVNLAISLQWKGVALQTEDNFFQHYS